MADCGAMPGDRACSHYGTAPQEPAAVRVRYTRRFIGSAVGVLAWVGLVVVLGVSRGDGARGDGAPSRLQSAIKKVFMLATKRIKIEGVEVVPFPLFEVLDGTDTRDYVQRVEPSVVGGRKMAKALMDAIYGRSNGGETEDEGSDSSAGLVMRRH